MENKEKEMEEGRVGRADSLQEELKAKARSDDDAIYNLVTRHDNSSGHIELREMEEGRVVYPTRPPRAVLPGQISAPKTPPTTFFVPQKPKEETKAREAVNIPKSSDVTDFAYAKEDSPLASQEPAPPVSQVTGEIDPVEEASPPPSSRRSPSSAVVSEIPMRRSPRRES